MFFISLLLKMECFWDEFIINGWYRWWPRIDVPFKFVAVILFFSNYGPFRALADTLPQKDKVFRLTFLYFFIDEPLLDLQLLTLSCVRSLLCEKLVGVEHFFFVGIVEVLSQFPEVISCRSNLTSLRHMLAEHIVMLVIAQGREVRVIHSMSTLRFVTNL